MGCIVEIALSSAEPHFAEVFFLCFFLLLGRGMETALFSGFGFSLGFRLGFRILSALERQLSCLLSN